MRSKGEIGRIVWHDLLTHDVEKAKRFYGDLLGWDFQIEHAKAFAWTSGEADYPLIVAGGEAHGGLVNPGDNGPSRWLAYVCVEDVDEAVANAAAFGATIERAPFDVPGVGRSAVIRDCQGAVIGVHMPTHGFPTPAGTFVHNELASDDVERGKRFYSALFGWRADGADQNGLLAHAMFKGVDGEDAAAAAARDFVTGSSASWLTYLATEDLEATVDRAVMLGARLAMAAVDDPTVGQIAVLTDPTGAMFGLMAPSETRQK